MSEMVRIDAIRTDGGTQPRARIDDSTVSEYAEAMEDGAKFPPVIVFFDGSDYWCADGFHRVAAMKKIDGREIEAEVWQGTQDDAIDYACSSLPNSRHGLRESPEDRHRRIETMLRKHPDWSNSQVADHCGVSHQTVGRVSDLSNGQVNRTSERTGRDGRTINTANIGKTRAPDPVVNETPLEEEDDEEPIDPLAESEPEPEPEPVQSHNATPIEDAISDIRIYINATLDELDSIAARHQVAREILIFMRDKTREFDQTA